MAKNMRTLLKKLFLNQWDYKCISLLLAVIIWLAVNHSQSTSKILEKVAVRVINIPPGFTVAGLLPNGILSERVSLTVSGKKLFLEEISSSDVEIVIDGTDKTTESTIALSKKHLFSLNPDIDLHKSITRIAPYRFPLQMLRLITEKIPVRLSQPIGEAPGNYEFVDVWPYNLYLTTSGPEPIIKDLKERGLTLTLNLNDISKNELDNIQSTLTDGHRDEISFPVPNEWKKISIPTLSDQPIEINDPRADDLKIDFIRADFHLINRPIPISLFYPTEYNLSLNPETYNTCIGNFIEKIHGIHYIHKTLYAKGVSKLFIEVVQDMLQLSVMLSTKNDKRSLDWCIQFINPSLLEENYLFRLRDIADETIRKDKADPDFAKIQENYLRNRFRKYMHQLQLYSAPNKKFDLRVDVTDHSLLFQEM